MPARVYSSLDKNFVKFSFAQSCGELMLNNNKKNEVKRAGALSLLEKRSSVLLAVGVRLSP